MMAIDDSFKKPGAIPFKWEIRPGVPKVYQQKQSPPVDHHRSFVDQEKEIKKSPDLNRSIPTTPQKLTPPPAGKSYFPPPLELRTPSFVSAPRTRSERHRMERSILSKPEIVSQGCFLTPMPRRKTEKKGTHKLKPEIESEPEPKPGYTSDLETLSRWSVSSRKSLSPFHDSPSSSSFLSNRSSPRPVSDAEWAGFGLF